MGRANYNTQIGICRLSSEPQGSLQQLIRKADGLMALEKTLDTALQPSFRGKVQLAAFRNGHLTLHCETATWATRVRLMQNQLMIELGKTAEFRGISRITLKIRPKQYKRRSSVKAKSISNQAREQLAETANHIADPDLSTALRSLAKRK